MSEMKSSAYQTTQISSTSVTAKYPCDWICKCPASDSVERAERELLTKLRDEVADEMASVHHSCERVHHPDIDCEVCRYKRAGMNQVLALLEKAGE